MRSPISRNNFSYLIHMCHDFTYEEWLKKLPKGVEPAYDGLELEV